MCQYQVALTEAVIQRRSVEKVFLEISQNSQENTCARDSILIKLQVNFESSCEFCEIFKNTFLYRTPLVVASALHETSFIGNLLYLPMIYEVSFSILYYNVLYLYITFTVSTKF